MDIAVFIECLTLAELESSIDETLNTLNKKFAAINIRVDFQEVGENMAVSWVGPAFALTCLWRPGLSNYCPLIAGYSDHQFSGLTAYETALLWLLSNRLCRYKLRQTRCADSVLIDHLALGGSIRTLAERSASTYKWRIKRLKKRFGVTTTPALIAEAIRRGSLS
ncbi:MAG: hypothetical protein P1U57_01960 [Oleibacter sp.]|nr:hypothetical protein [Thalassolituus sp.]